MNPELTAELSTPAENENSGTRRVGGLSTLLVSRPVILFCFAAFLIADLLDSPALSALFLFFTLLGLISRFWGLRALRNVTVSAEGSKTILAAGEDVELRYRLENRKRMPVPWIELRQPLPVNACLEPQDGFERYDLDEMEQQQQIKQPASVYHRRIAFVMGYQSVSWETVWHARRRGIYQLSRLSLLSGDGFGLTQTSAEIPIDRAPTVVIYPKRVPVTADYFYRNVWSGQYGKRGILEDTTVLKNVRRYQPGDPWKRIDWRMAARSGETYVREFERMQPNGIHFIVDGASFLHLSDGNEELEESLSILASLMFLLETNGTHCGLSLPQTDRQPCTDIAPSDRRDALTDLLFQLAAFDGDSASGLFSASLLRDFQNAGRPMYLVAYSPAAVTCGELLQQLDPQQLTALLWIPDAPPSEAFPAETARLSLRSFREGGAAG